METAEAQALVERHGGIGPAAAASGVSYSTFYRALNPAYRERERASDRAYKRKRYRNLTGVEYNGWLLARRRQQALQRMEKRNQRRQEEATNG